MKILVTGSEGFIGTYLSYELAQAGHSVAGFDRVNGADLNRNGHFEEILGTWLPDVCVHLAAKVGRIHGEEGLEDTARMNAGVTCNVAKACADYGVRLVYASTSEVYGDTGTRICHEDDILVRLPHNLYGLSKRWGEEAAQLYAPEGLTIWRISMPYGPGQPSAEPGRHAAISAFLRAAKERRPLPVHFGAKRSWCYITDTVRAMRLTIERSDGGVFNIGRADENVSMLWVASLACKIAGAPSSLIEMGQPKTSQTLVKRLSDQKIRDLGWEPRVNLREGMKLTYEGMD